MPELKLTYFDLRGRAEATRLALTIGDIPFEDVRIAVKDWPEHKPKTPYGSLPTLTVDGVEAAQSLAILRYAGKLSGLYPTDALQALKVDEIMDTLSDIGSALMRYRGPDKEKLQAEREKFCSEDVPRYMGGMEKQLGDEWAVGDSMTIADLELYLSLVNVKSGQWDFVPEDVADRYPKALAIYEKVKSDPKVVEWYKK